MELGFLEEAGERDGSEESEAAVFASKVGGKPVWPDLRGLPAHLDCAKCGKPLTFLLQIHAPLTSLHAPLTSSSEEEDEEARTLLVFMCHAPQCHSPGDARCFVALRYEGGGVKGNASPAHKATPITQGQSNTDASDQYEDVDSSDGDLKSSQGVNSQNSSSVSPRREESILHHLCIVCGGRGSKHCGGCRRVSYCSRDHQLHDWRLGHKKLCAELSKLSPPTSIAPSTSLPPPPLSYDPSAGVSLAEWELVTEVEPEACWKGAEERSERERMADYERYVRKRGGGSKVEELSGEELESMVRGRKESGHRDKVFSSFMKRIAQEKQQVLRYGRRGQELFVSGEGIPKKSDIPKCGCGAERTFELQIMPQLLYYLKLDHPGSIPSTSLTNHTGIDWGTLLVYTCGSDTCRLGQGYHTEFLWKQEINPNH